MQWLNKIVDELFKLHPDGEIIVSSGVSPSGKYHFGTLREILTAEAIAREGKRRGRAVKHLHIVDDLDFIRKVPIGVPDEFKQYLGKPLCDIPAPDGSNQSYADYYLQDLIAASKQLHLEAEIIRAHQKYRQGFFVQAIEISLDKTAEIKAILETVSGHKVDDNWSPVQVLEDGYLKNRPIISRDSEAKSLVYKDTEGNERQVDYAKGEVKLNWRIDWPARWWLLGVDAEPFGRDHATKGGSYDTGKVLVKDIFGAPAPLPVPYHFINRSGETKKMSKSAGDTITLSELLEVLPAEVLWYFILRSAPDKQLFFDEGDSLIRIVDQFGELLSKTDKSEADQQLIDLSLYGIDQPTISRIPFSLLVASYQAALKDEERTLQIIGRTEYAEVVRQDATIIKNELRFIDAWLKKYAPEEVNFELRRDVDSTDFTDIEKLFLSELAPKVKAAPEDADGAWFHEAIYSLKDSTGLSPKQLFTVLYRLLIAKESGPRAGWFLSILPRDWLIKRLKLEA